MLSGMTYIGNSQTPDCDFTQVAESHVFIGILRDSQQVVKAFPLTMDHPVASGSDHRPVLAAIPALPMFLPGNPDLTRWQKNCQSYINYRSNGDFPLPSPVSLWFRAPSV
jgi:hypothetical protein